MSSDQLPVLHTSDSPAPEVHFEEYLPTTETAGFLLQETTTNSEHSFDSLNSFESDQWSQRGISSRVSINPDIIQQSEEDDEKRHKQCRWLHKLWRNCILPGIFGIDNYRLVDKMYHKEPIAKQLLINVITYNNIIRGFIKDGLVTKIKALATQMYFPTGQIEADGLSVISGEIWAATYLLLCIYESMREADFHSVRSAYSSLAWDSGLAHRAILKFHQIYFEFREHIVPIWREIEKVVGLPENSDFYLVDGSDPAPGMLSQSLKYTSDNIRKKVKSKIQAPQAPPPLPEIRIRDELLLHCSLDLRIIPEMKSALLSMSDFVEKDFNELEYGKQMEIIKELLAKPSDVLHNGLSDLKQIQLNLLNDRAVLEPGMENDISCTRSLKILRETLKLLYKEVKLTPSLRFDISETIRATSEDIQSFLTYTEWVISKISEFHSMLRLCYNFALSCFDLDLPNFDKVLTQVRVSEEVFKPTSVSTRSGSKNNNRLKDEQLEFKVKSLTKLMMEASMHFSTIQKQSAIDDNFHWEDFYKTDYHLVLQRLPLRLGYNLLQFNAKQESKVAVQQNNNGSGPNTPKESKTNVPPNVWSVYRKEQPQRGGSDSVFPFDSRVNQSVPEPVSV